MARVIVCGGRAYSDLETVYRTLDALLPSLEALACGGAPGADTLALEWARGRGFPCDVFMADWQAHGRAAGPIRNQRMLEEFRPTLVIAFPGGRGTADMVRRAHGAGVTTIAFLENEAESSNSGLVH